MHAHSRILGIALVVAVFLVGSPASADQSPPMSPIIQDVTGGTLNTLTHVYTPAAARVLTTYTWLDGFKIEVLRLDENVPSRVPFTRQTPGFRWVFPVVRITNGSDATQYFNPFYFRLVDGTSVRRAPTCCDNRNDDLGSGTLIAGESVTGSMMFEAPVADRLLMLLYDEGILPRHQPGRMPLY